MLSLGAATQVYLRPGATDLRLGYEGLFQLARARVGPEGSPLSGQQVFAFCNRSRTRLKLLLHDGSGTWLCCKRLDAGCYTWPAEGAADPVTAAQLWALVAGLEVSGWKKHWRH